MLKYGVCLTFSENLDTDEIDRRLASIGMKAKPIQECQGAEGTFLTQVAEAAITPEMRQQDADTLIKQYVKQLGPLTTFAIVDPYLFDVTKNEIDKYCSRILYIIEPLLLSLTQLILIVGKRNYDVENRLTSAIGRLNSGISVNIIKAQSFHDRIWVGDRGHGFLTGTSLNSLTGKYSALTWLDHDDSVTFRGIIEKCVNISFRAGSQ